MDEATKARLRALMTCPVGQLNLGDAVWAMLVLEDAPDEDLHDLVGFVPPPAPEAGTPG